MREASRPRGALLTLSGRVTRAVCVEIGGDPISLLPPDSIVWTERGTPVPRPCSPNEIAGRFTHEVRIDSVPGDSFVLRVQPYGGVGLTRRLTLPSMGSALPVTHER